MTLKFYGYAVETASSAAEALEKLPGMNTTVPSLSRTFHSVRYG
jgi:hypothetical protein